MGMFDFISDAGAKLFGKDVDVTEPTGSLSDHIRDNGLDPSNLSFAFSTQAVTISGTMPSQEDKEKVVLIVGNVKSIASVNDQIVVAAVGNAPEATETVTIEAAPPAVTDTAPDDWSSRTYTVVSGDTLSGIAKAMYGNANKYHEIFAANQPMLESPDKIYPGQVLRIPNLD